MSHSARRAPDLAAQIEHEQAYALYRQGPMVSRVTAIVGASLVAAMWEHAPHQELLVWYGLSLSNQVVRLYMCAAFQRCQPRVGETWVWLRRYQISMMVGGMVFGGLAVFLFPDGDPLGQAILLFFVCMMAVGSITANAYHPPTLWIFLAFALPPMLVRLALLQGLASYIFAFMFAFFTLSVFLFARNQSVLLLESIKIRFHNLDLIEDLKIKTELAEVAQRQAEQASLAKSKFFAAASHDLRQPLQALELFSSSLQKTHYPPEESYKVEQIRRSVDALSSLFDELLDISKLDAGYVKPAPAHFKADDLFARLNSTFSPLALDKKIKLRFFKSTAALHTDPVLIERVLGNLIDNALRYTARGGVLVGCRRRSGHFSLEVWDTGNGIAADKFEQIFDEFYQIGNPERDRRRGLGLGLATVKRIAALLGCRISLDSRLQRGSVFRIEVAAGEAARVAPVVAQDTADLHVDLLDGRTILVIDDESSVRQGLAELLQQWGCRVVAAASAADALADLAMQGVKPDAMIVDYRLRENADGISAIAAVREKFGADLPALLISGDTAVALFKAAEEHNLPLLQKPVRAAKLRATLTHFFAR